jgi:hypothetical protein
MQATRGIRDGNRLSFPSAETGTPDTQGLFRGQFFFLRLAWIWAVLKTEELPSLALLQSTRLRIRCCSHPYIVGQPLPLRLGSTLRHDPKLAYV